MIIILEMWIEEQIPGRTSEMFHCNLFCIQKVISRDDVLKHAEKAMEDLGTGKPLLEIQYDSEVRTVVCCLLLYCTIVLSHVL